MIGSVVFVKSVAAGESRLVKVMADGRQLGILAFTEEQWQSIEQDGSLEIFVATQARVR